MAGSPKFRVDVIFHSLRELQQEKELLETRLHEQRNQCKALEGMLDAVDIKHKQCNERNMKMTETVNVARQKVLQTENQVERLKQLNEEKRSKITEIHDKIKEEELKECEEYKSFENQLEDLADKIRNGRNYYTKENLQSEIGRWNRVKDASQKEADTHVITMNELADALENIELEEAKIRERMQETLEYGVTRQDLQSALAAFTDMNKEASQLAYDYQTKIEKERHRLAELKSAHRLEQTKYNQHMQLENNEPVEMKSTPGIAFETTTQSTVDLQPEPLHKQQVTTYGQELQTSRCVPTDIGPQAEEKGGSRGTTKELNYGEDTSKASALMGRSFFISLPFNTKR